MKKICEVCDWKRVYALGRCRSCYVYLRRHGYDKDETYLIQEGRRWLDSVIESARIR